MSYSPTLGRFLERDPEGYVDGMNTYEFVGSNPVNRLDPLGLYKITWDAGSNWTQAETDRVLASLRRVRIQARLSSCQITALIDNLKKRVPPYNKACDYTPVIKELEKLRCIMDKITDGYDSKEEKLKFAKANFNPDASLRWNPKTFGPNSIEFNSNAKKPWGTLSLENLDKCLMHELSHEYGTEDDDSKGRLVNAHILEELATIDYAQMDLAQWNPVKWLIFQCEKGTQQQG